MIIAASFDINNPELWINRGLSYGDGLFETMRFYQNRIPLLDYHLQRLAKGLKKLQLDEFDGSLIEPALKTQLIDQREAVIKLMVFRASQKRTYQPLTHEIDWLLTSENYPPNSSNKPLKLRCSRRKISHQPVLAGVKHLSRLEQVILASELNQHNDIDDLLITDVNNHIIETSHQNLVMIQNNELWTPELSKAGVDGVALQWLKENHDVNTQHIKIEDVISYDCIMTCNSIRGFSLVDSIEQTEKQCISFGTRHDIHDKITRQWDALFNT